MITIAPIVPTAYLEKVGLGAKVHLVLAHQVMSDTRYAAFYRRQSDTYVILDNSAFELGEAVATEVIIKTAGLIRPDEVVLPDVLYDAAKTLSRVTAFLQEHKTAFPADMHFMAVPHGESLEEYISCYQELAGMPDVYALGIGTIYNYKFPGGRKAIFKTLQERGILSDKPHHLLGLGDSGHMELRALKGYGVIRSCDSSAAYIQALHGMHIQPDYPYKKIRSKIVFEDPYREDTAVFTEANLKVLQEASL